jgi:hypothetical protein
MQIKGNLILKIHDFGVRFHILFMERNVQALSGYWAVTSINYDMIKNLWQASNQETPNNDEKSCAARDVSVWAHSVCMLFSGIGVPLIRSFRMSPFFYLRYSLGVFYNETSSWFSR